MLLYVALCYLLVALCYQRGLILLGFLVLGYFPLYKYKRKRIK